MASGFGAESWGISPFTNTQREDPFHRRAMFAGSNLVSTLAIAKGWCSPALPLKVHVRSNPFGPRTFISPTVVFARADDGHSPISWPVAQSVFDQRSDFRPDARVTGIMQFE